MTGVAILDALARELTLFAAFGFLLGGIDDLLVDLVWIVGRIRRRFARDPGIADLPRPAAPMRFAIFVAAWREAGVIGPMLRSALRTIDHPNFRIFVGTYPNDAATIADVMHVAAVDPRIRLVVGPTAGPTTKADNLNVLWRALISEDGAGGYTDAIVLHDAEDVIHADELAVHEIALADADVVQTPVEPLIHPAGRLVSGVYADEFAESHRRAMPVRSLIGAGLPLAGVGCAFRTDALARLAGAHGVPFDADSHVEDYELGLKLADAGCYGRFARVRGRDGTLVATRAYFPHELDASVRQKARWMAGIALSGWDRIGWSRPLAVADHWMRMRDRRAPLAVIVLACGYLALVTWGLAWLLHGLLGTSGPPQGAPLRWLLWCNGVLLVWRMAMRAMHTASVYGWVEGVRAVPRVIVANYIALLAVRRALWRYVAVLGGEAQRWDKTDHVFPELDPVKAP